MSAATWWNPHDVTHRPKPDDVFWPECNYADPALDLIERIHRSPILGRPHTSGGLYELCDDVVRTVVADLEDRQYPLITLDHRDLFAFKLDSEVVPALDGSCDRVEMAVSDPGIVTENLILRLQSDVFRTSKWAGYCLNMCVSAKEASIRLGASSIRFGDTAVQGDLDAQLVAWRTRMYDALEEQNGHEVRNFLHLKASIKASKHQIDESIAHLVCVSERFVYLERTPIVWLVVPKCLKYSEGCVPVDDGMSQGSDINVSRDALLGVQYLSYSHAAGYVRRFSFPQDIFESGILRVRAWPTDAEFSFPLDPASMTTIEELQNRYGRVWPRGSGRTTCDL